MFSSNSRASSPLRTNPSRIGSAIDVYEQAIAHKHLFCDAPTKPLSTITTNTIIVGAPPAKLKLWRQESKKTGAYNGICNDITNTDFTIGEEMA